MADRRQNCSKLYTLSQPGRITLHGGCLRRRLALVSDWSNVLCGLSVGSYFARQHSWGFVLSSVAAAKVRIAGEKHIYHTGNVSFVVRLCNSMLHDRNAAKLCGGVVPGVAV
jgi:hypothetical protein